MSGQIDMGSGIAACVLGDVLVILWRDPATLERVRWLTQRMRAEATKRPDGILMLQIILGTSTPPGAEARAESTRSVTAIKSHLRRAVTLPAGDALWGSVVRTIMRALFLVTGQSNLQAVAPTLTDALARIRERASPATPSDAQLRDTVSALFAALEVPIHPVCLAQPARAS